MDDYESIIDKIAQINQSTGAPDLTSPVANLLNNKEKSINIAVLGQFKSGKSSLINNLVGENILPVGVVPVTAIVTCLQYASFARLVVQFNDGKQTEATLKELPFYVTEKQNPENIQNVAQVIVEHPALEPFKNIRLVDTPGLGSFYQHNSKTTLQWLPFTGVAIICVSAERPLSEEDINLVKGIASYCPDVVLAITKTDLFGTKELYEIKTYISESLKKAINKDIPVFEYSICKNTQEYRNNLIENLINPLNNNYEKKFNEIIRHKTITIIEQSRQYAELALQAALKREQEKNSVKRLLQEININRHYHERDMLLSGTSFKGAIREKLEKIFLPYQRQITEKVSNLFNNNYLEWSGVLYQVSQKYEGWLKETLENEITQLDNHCFDSVNYIIKEMIGYYEYTASQFHRQLDKKLSQIFNVHLPEVSWKIDFTGIDKPDISIYRSFDSHLDMLLFFLPMKWFRGLFYNHFRNQIPYETEKNLYRYISELTGKIIKTINNIHNQVVLYINNEVKTVENILQNEKGNLSVLEKNKEKLKNLQSAFILPE